MSPQRRNRDYSASEKLSAFLLYQEKGLGAVERRYPEHLAFVIANKHKTYQNVKDEVFGLVLQF